jgi:hypothetical protein
MSWRRDKGGKNGRERKEGRRVGRGGRKEREIPGQNFVGEHICMSVSGWPLSACIPNFGKPVNSN